MDEVWQQQQEFDNESGMDLCEQWHYEQWHEKNHRLLDGFDKVRPIIKGEANGQAGNNDSTQTPF